MLHKLIGSTNSWVRLHLHRSEKVRSTVACTRHVGVPGIHSRDERASDAASVVAEVLAANMSAFCISEMDESMHFKFVTWINHGKFKPNGDKPPRGQSHVIHF